MAGHTKLEGEWLLLSVAVARMGELSPIYRTFPGYACRDLEIAIRARRGCSPWWMLLLPPAR